MDLSYCVVNTNGRELLLACLASIRDHGPAELEAEILVVDNASDDGSADAVEQLERFARGARRAPAADPRRAARRQGGARHAAARRGPRRALPAAERGLRAAPRGGRRRWSRRCEADPQARRRRRAAARPRRAGRSPAPGACPGSRRSIAGALFLHRLLVTESGGARTREVGWVQSAAMLVRRDAAERGRLPRPGVLRLLRRDRLLQAPAATPAGESSTSPPPSVVHHEQLATDRAARERRIVEFHRGRDRYLRKHHGAAVARGSRRALRGVDLCGPGAGGAVVLPGHEPGLYRLHARQALRPERGEGLREAAEAYNAARSRRS